METLMRFLKDEGGATAIEYGLIASLIAVVIIAAVTVAGLGVKSTFNDVAVEMGQTAAP